MNINRIYFEKRRKVKVPEITNLYNNNCYIATILKNFEAYGYTLSEDIIISLRYCDSSEIVIWYKEVMDAIIKSKGQIKAEPLYPGFPQQVMETSQVKLYIDAIMYYLSNYQITPENTLGEKLPLLDNVKLEVINIGTMEDFYTIFTNLLESKSSITPRDIEIIDEFIESGMYIQCKIPKEIPMKEIAAHTLAKIMKVGGNIKAYFNCLSTATDILRLVTALNDGDITLVENTRFKSMKRSTRRSLLYILNSIDSKKVLEDVYRHREKWIALGKVLHPEDYPKYKNIYHIFNVLRNERLNHNTFNAIVEKAIREVDIQTLLKILPTRPGEFARRLDHILRITANDIISKEMVIDAFQKVATDVPTKLLLQLIEHFRRRNTVNPPVRAFFPKGSVAKIKVIENKLNSAYPIDAITCHSIVFICIGALYKNFKELDPMGKVYISKDLKGIKVPTSLRNLSETTKVLARGSRLPIDPKAEAIRFFIYWKDNTNMTGYGTDIDLSAACFGEDFEYIDNISFSKLKMEKGESCHSGDVREASKGGVEYIDINLKAMKDQGIKYVSANVLVYCGDTFNDLPECFAGYMERQCVDSGEAFDPKTVKFKSDIVVSNKLVMPLLIDLDNNQIIWTDMPLKNTNFNYNTVGGNKGTIRDAMRAIANIETPNLYNLLKLHAKARGELVDNKEEADIIFDMEEGITPFQTDIILSQYL